MTILHQIQHSPFENQALKCCLRYATKDDTILLVGNAVNTLMHKPSKALLEGFQVLVLEEDVKARGLTQQANGFELIDYQAFVTLTFQHNKVISW